MPGIDNPIANQSEKLPKPAELTGASIEKPSVLLTALKDEKEAAAPTSDDVRAVSKDRFQFGSFVHNYVCEGILFAEQKAAFTFAAGTAFLGYLVTTIPSNFIHMAWMQQVPLVSALVLLVSSILLVITVVMPRLGGDLRGLVYFKAIAARSTPGEYISDVARASQPELDSATMQHVYEIAVICVRKYELLRWAIWLGLFGFAAGLLWLAVLHTPRNDYYI